MLHLQFRGNHYFGAQDLLEKSSKTGARHMRMIHKTQASLCIFASEGNGLLVVPGTHREDIRLSYGMPDAINERDQHTALTGQFKLTAEAEERAELVRLCLSFNLSFQARFAHIHIVANGSFPKPVEFLSFFLRNLISPTLRSFFCVFVRFSLFFFRFLEIVSCGNFDKPFFEFIWHRPAGFEEFSFPLTSPDYELQ